MSRHLFKGLPLLLLSVSACGPVHTAIRPSAADIGAIRKLALVVTDEGSFTVIRERAKATAAPAVLFGLVGAAVASAHNQALDSREAEALAPQLSGFSARSTLRESFVRTLKESGRLTDVHVLEKEPDATESRNYDALIAVRIKDWGLRLPAPTGSEQLAAFVEFQATMVRPTTRETLWDEHDTVLGQGRYGLGAYREDTNLLRRELNEAIEGAGYRMAVHLLYPKEEKK